MTTQHRRSLFGDPAATLAPADAEAAERQARLSEEQGLMLSEVIRRICDALQGEVLGLVTELAGPQDGEDGQAVERFAATVAGAVRTRWPAWLSRIVPEQIAAVTGEEETPTWAKPAPTPERLRGPQP
ncbi:hypothetical protein [Nonomuraea polychroma]|uniref:hypothetical protein n=1 Tax=Nonomuraea polychroma TaxID=46176 RepID=UPI0013E2CF70|nr:hypothetical protein [Nonomuraea polychroma]